MPEGSPFGSPIGLEFPPDIRGPGKHHTQRHSEDGTAASKPDLTKKNNTPSERAANMDAALKGFPAPNYNVHAFYYTWYGNPQFDGKYIHWNHPLLPHWDTKVAAGYQTGRHKPPDDVGANFYPALGAYSSKDPSVIEAHMQQLRTAAVGRAMGVVGTCLLTHFITIYCSWYTLFLQESPWPLFTLQGFVMILVMIVRFSSCIVVHFIPQVFWQFPGTHLVWRMTTEKQQTTLCLCCWRWPISIMWRCVRLWGLYNKSMSM